MVHPSLDSFFLFVTTLGGGLFVTCVTFIAATYLLYRKEVAMTIILVATMAGSALISVGLKLVFARDRPDLWVHLVEEATFAFPSGHAVASSALALCAVLFTWRTKWRYATAVLAGLYVLVIGVSRLYLGVHYPTDVIGGWLISAIWIFLVASLVIGYRYRKRAYGTIQEILSKEIK